MSAEDVKKQVRTHLTVFAAVLILAVMAGISVIAGTSSIPAVLAIAAVEVALVLGFLMHARTEGPWVKSLILFCALFVGSLIALKLLGHYDRIEGTEDIVVEAAPQHAQEAEEAPADKAAAGDTSEPAIENGADEAPESQDAAVAEDNAATAEPEE